MTRVVGEAAILTACVWASLWGQQGPGPAELEARIARVEQGLRPGIRSPASRRRECGSPTA